MQKLANWNWNIHIIILKLRGLNAPFKNTKIAKLDNTMPTKNNNRKNKIQLHGFRKDFQRIRTQKDWKLNYRKMYFMQILSHTMKLMILIITIAQICSFIQKRRVSKNSHGQLMVSFFLAPPLPRRSHLHYSSDCLFIQ